MFAHKKNYGRAGYVDNPLPNIVYTVDLEIFVYRNFRMINFRIKIFS